MASANIGSGSNDATGSNLIRMAWLKKKQQLEERITDLCDDLSVNPELLDRYENELEMHLKKRPW